jgi:DNA (cytosine-5)-methyltransferase 1
VIHYGDITKISGYEVPIVDCAVGGSPCQDLSVAGKRAGLDGERSGLFMEQIRITKEMRDKDAQSGRTGEFIRPRFMVWENVPGAFSSNKGEDFRIVLEEIAKVVQEDAVIPMPPKNKWTTSGCIMGDGWSIAWRILDAQFWGVPQRRRRIALVADFGGGCAPEILFVRKSLRGDFEESRTERQGTSADAQGCTPVHDREGEAYCYDIGDRRRVPNEYVDKSPALLSQMGTGGNNVPVVVEGVYVYNQTVTGDKTMTLTNCATDPHHIPCVVKMSYQDRVGSLCARGHKGVGSQYVEEDKLVVEYIAKGPGAVCYCLQGNGIDRADTAGCNGSGWKEGICYTLNTIDRHAVVYNGENITNPLNKTNPQIGDACHTLTSDSRNYLVETKPHYIVRRLTPLECERLQGFADGWTDIGEYTDSKGKKKKTSDSARYKALGNSIALPPWKWVIKRLCSHYEREATMASLFDGIGGFPCLWEQINGKGTAIWASEIEDFPMAVTKVRIE